MAQRGIIYLITNKRNDCKYVGEDKEPKTKHEKWLKQEELKLIGILEERKTKREEKEENDDDEIIIN